MLILDHELAESPKTALVQAVTMPVGTRCVVGPSISFQRRRRRPPLLSAQLTRKKNDHHGAHEGTEAETPPPRAEHICFVSDTDICCAIYGRPPSVCPQSRSHHINVSRSRDLSVPFPEPEPVATTAPLRTRRGHVVIFALSFLR